MSTPKTTIKFELLVPLETNRELLKEASAVGISRNEVIRRHLKKSGFTVPDVLLGNPSLRKEDADD